MNRERALTAFKDYTANFDTSNISISLKIAHTYRVAQISERIAKTVVTKTQITDEKLKNCADFAWLIGLLHDIGRFEQITRYGTFQDAVSVDHAELGADILFKNNLFGKFVIKQETNLTSEAFLEMKNTAETAIRLHNKLNLPQDMPLKSMTYTKILRDADKIDIFRVLNEAPYTGRNLKGLAVNEKIMQFVREHRCVPRQSGNLHINELEKLVAQCCMAFELEYSESRKIVNEQGYLAALLNQDSEQLAFVKAEIMNDWENKKLLQ